MTPDGELAPGLATSWQWVGTGFTTFEFVLRQNARFSDGTSVNAQAVKTWLDYAKGQGLSSLLFPIASVTTTGPWTVQIHLSQPDPSLPFYLTENANAGQVNSPNAVAASGPKSPAGPLNLGNASDGAGPYKLDPSQTVTGDHYTFVPNPYFFDPTQIKYSKITFKVIANASSMLAAATTGQVDVAFGDPTTAPAAQKAGLNIVSGPSQTAVIFFQDIAGTYTKALGDPRVRQALNYAVDRATIGKALFGKYAQPTSELLTADGGSPAYQNQYPYDPAKARALLSEAGYPNGFTLTLAASADAGTGGVPFAQAVAKYLEAVGVKVTFVSETNFTTFVNAVVQSAGQKISAITYDLTGDETWVVNRILFPSPPKVGASFFIPVQSADPTLVALNQTAAASDSPSDWQAVMGQTVTEAKMLPVLTTDSLYFVDKKVAGVQVNQRVFYPSPLDWSPQ